MKIFTKSLILALGLILSTMLTACEMLPFGKTTTAQQTSNNTTANATTQAPTTAAQTTKAFDYSKFVNMIDVDDAEYKFDFEQIVTPYYYGNVIYNETVLLIKDGDTISGTLEYTPLKVLSIRDYTWETEYDPSQYTIEGNVISITEESTLPYLTKANLSGIDLPSKYREVTSISNVLTDWMMMGGTIYTESDIFYGHQVSVSYVFDPQEVKYDEFAHYETSGLEKTKAKLNAGEDLKIVVTGDSVAEGCSSSKHFNHAPYLDNFVDLFTKELNNEYTGKITTVNKSVGGKTSDWGSANQQLQAIINEQPDLVYIHFGINDLGQGSSPNGFKENMESIILTIQAALPDCEFVIINAYAPNGVSYDMNQMRKFWAKMYVLTEEIDNVYILDMFTLSQTIISKKSYYSTCANGINHVNDYTSRLYCMNMLAQLIDYQNK